MLLMMDKVKFGLWLQAERTKQELSQAELAKKAGLHRQSINKIENGGASPAVETYLSLADALELSPITLFRAAGLLPDQPANDVNFDDWKYLIEQMSPKNEAEMRKIAIMKIESDRQEESKSRAGEFKPNHEKKK